MDCAAANGHEAADPEFLLLKVAPYEFCGMGWTAHLLPNRRDGRDLIACVEGSERSYHLPSTKPDKRAQPASAPAPPPIVQSTPVDARYPNTSLLARIAPAWLVGERGGRLQRQLQERVGSQARVERLPIGFLVTGQEKLLDLARRAQAALDEVDANLQATDPMRLLLGPIQREALLKPSPMGAVPILHQVAPASATAQA